MKYAAILTRHCRTFGLLLLAACTGCETGQSGLSASSLQPPPPAVALDSMPAQTPPPPVDYDSTQWLEIISLDSTIILDLRYATTDNFVNEAMYDCGRCFFRPAVARALLAAHRELRQQGLGLKFFDCDRPGPIQWKLWNKVPDPRFVADPRKGSVHGRGGAADLTIVDSLGKELDMGVPFDYFGAEGYHDYRNLPAEVLANRQLLRETMARHQMVHIRTEWWHYSYRLQQFDLSDWLWACP